MLLRAQVSLGCIKGFFLLLMQVQGMPMAGKGGSQLISSKHPSAFGCLRCSSSCKAVSSTLKSYRPLLSICRETRELTPHMLIEARTLQLTMPSHALPHCRWAAGIRQTWPIVPIAPSLAPRRLIAASSPSSTAASTTGKRLGESDYGHP